MLPTSFKSLFFTPKPIPIVNNTPITPMDVANDVKMTRFFFVNIFWKAIVVEKKHPAFLFHFSPSSFLQTSFLQSFVSWTIFPSNIHIFLSACSARTLSWVTMITVTFLSLLICFNRASISVAELESIAPVGSSANRMSGFPASALAIATLCFCPPESCDGRCFSRPFKPTISNNSILFFFLRLFSTPFNCNTISTFRWAVINSIKLNCWKI